MKTGHLNKFLSAALLVFLAASPAAALSKFNGSYSTTASFESKKVVGNGACQTSPQSTISFQIFDVKYKKRTQRATGKVVFSGDPTVFPMTGEKMKGGIFLRFSVPNYYGYDFRYKFFITEVTRTSVHVHYRGATFYTGTANGCAYNYGATATHSNY